MLHSVLPGHATFAVNTGISEMRWIKPFLRFAQYYALDPTKPLATRGLVNTVKSGQTIMIFPEASCNDKGRLDKLITELETLGLTFVSPEDGGASTGTAKRPYLTSPGRAAARVRGRAST